MKKPTMLSNKSSSAWSCAENQIFVGFLRIKSSEQDFKYLYWRISKILLWHVLTWKGIYMIDWVGRSTSSLKIDEIDKSIPSIQASKSQKRDFRDFSGAKVCYWNGNVRFENFMHVEWSEEKFLKGIVVDKRRLRFWNKHQKIESLFTQLAR